MSGHNRLLVALEDGHSVETMERTYAAWTRGAKPEDVELIKAAFAGRPPGYDYSADTSRRRRYSKRPLKSPGAVTKLSTEAVVEGINAPGVAVETEESKAVSPCYSREIASESPQEDMAGVAGLFGPDGPHPFGAALRTLAQQITWTAWPRHATRDSSHITEPCGRYPALRGSILEQHSAATNYSNRNIWLGWLDYSAGRPHPFGAALRALAQQITWTALPRHATRDSSHITEPCGRYPALRGSTLEQHSAATNYSNR